MHRNPLTMVNVNLSQLKDAVAECKTQLLDVINTLQRRVEELEREKRSDKNIIEDLMRKNVELEKKIDSKYDEYVNRIQNETRASLTESVKTWSSVAKSKQPVEQLIVVNAAINEAKDRERRKKNVVVFGLKESTKTAESEKQLDDKINVEKMIDATGSTAKILFVKRFKSKSDKPGPVLVGLTEFEDRNPLLLKAKNLKQKSGYESVYISPDLTDAERMEDRNLRKQRDDLNAKRNSGDPFRYAIRGNQIVKFKVQSVSPSSGSQ